MSVMNRILIKLHKILKQENPSELDIYVICDCQVLPLNRNTGEIGIPHNTLDLRAEGCLALGAKSQFYLKEMRRETSAIMRNEIFVPQIFYACRFYHALKTN